MRKLAILEPLLMFGLIVAYIWKLRFVQPERALTARRDH